MARSEKMVISFNVDPTTALWWWHGCMHEQNNQLLSITAIWRLKLLYNKHIHIKYTLERILYSIIKLQSKCKNGGERLGYQLIKEIPPSENAAPLPPSHVLSFFFLQYLLEYNNCCPIYFKLVYLFPTFVVMNYGVPNFFLLLL